MRFDATFPLLTPHFDATFFKSGKVVGIKPYFGYETS
jgi:hypothetical protein